MDLSTHPCLQLYTRNVRIIVYGILYFVTGKTDDWMLLRRRGSSDNIFLFILRTAAIPKRLSNEGLSLKIIFFLIMLSSCAIIAKRLNASDNDVQYNILEIYIRKPA